MSSALPSGDAFGNVEQNDVAQLFQRRKMRKCAADLPRANKGDLGSGHDDISVSGLRWGGDSEMRLALQGGMLHCKIGRLPGPKRKQGSLFKEATPKHAKLQ